MALTAGRFGAATATSNISVGAKVVHCVAGTGAVLTQHRTDPRWWQRIGHRFGVPIRFGIEWPGGGDIRSPV
ncbi:MAG TPA: DUF1028 domain-containing protein [Acetobacteraceae bacterium]|nr:DUF1028 domain-containing protein [Acetobacteraceae bacterium]